MSDEMDNNIIHPGQPTHDRGKPIAPPVTTEIEKLRAALKKISATARRKDETPETLLVACDAIARAPLGEGP
jgi:hypothetical protein